MFKELTLVLPLLLTWKKIGIDIAIDIVFEEKLTLLLPLTLTREKIDIAIAIDIDVSDKLTLLLTLILRHEKIDIDIAIDSFAAESIDIAIAIENFWGNNWYCHWPKNSTIAHVWSWLTALQGNLKWQKNIRWISRVPWERPHLELRNEPPLDSLEKPYPNPFMASLWSRLAIKGFGSGFSRPSSGGSFRSSRWGRSHGTLEIHRIFFCHFKLPWSTVLDDVIVFWFLGGL